MDGPLHAEDLVEINNRLGDLLLADEEIKLAEQAGLDVTGLRETARNQRQQLIKIKQTYFPGS